MPQVFRVLTRLLVPVLEPTRLSWTRQFGTDANDHVQAMALDDDGSIIIAGFPWGAFTGSNLGMSDAFVRKYSPEGTIVWTEQFGTAERDSAIAVGIDPEGNIVVTGNTRGKLGDNHHGSYDVFVRKFGP